MKDGLYTFKVQWTQEGDTKIHDEDIQAEKVHGVWYSPRSTNKHGSFKAAIKTTINYFNRTIPTRGGRVRTIHSINESPIAYTQDK